MPPSTTTQKKSTAKVDGGDSHCSARVVLLADGRSFLHPLNFSGWNRACLRGEWKALVNGYWSPGYPFLLSCWFFIFKTSPAHEPVAGRVFNCIILLAALFWLEYFLNGINLFLNVRARGTEDAALPMWTFRAMGYAVFSFSSLLLTRPSLDTPDNLVVAFILLSADVLLRIASEPLLGEQAEMAGNAEPFTIFLDPRVGETAMMFVMFAFSGSLLVGCASDDDGIAVAVKLHVF